MHAGLPDTPSLPAPHTEDWRSKEAVDGSSSGWKQHSASWLARRVDTGGVNSRGRTLVSAGKGKWVIFSLAWNSMSKGSG